MDRVSFSVIQYFTYFTSCSGVSFVNFDGN